MADSATIGFRIKNFCGLHYRGLMVVVFPVIFTPVLFLKPVLEFRCMFILLVMAFYWITEIIPLYATALIPLVAFPLANIMDSKSVSQAYFNDALILTIGGLMIALAIEYSNLHRRVALGVILIVGCSPRRLHLGLCIVSMFLSMWVSNNAVTAMFCPIIKAVLEELESQGMVKLTLDKPVTGDEPPFPSRTVLCYYFGVAYSATIGGCGTLIGTSTNLTYKGIYETRFPESSDVDFISFMAFSSPPMLLELLGMYLWLQFFYQGLLRPNSVEAQEISNNKASAAMTKNIIHAKYNELGSLKAHEVQVGLLFIFMIIMLFTRKPGVFTGWADILKLKLVKGSNPMILVALMLFLLPANYKFLKYFIGRRPEKEAPTLGLLTWKFTHDNLPWGLMFLLGGGFALAKGINASGFSKMVGHSLSVLKPLPLPVIQLICIIVAVFLTAFSSNVAICNILVPVLCELAIAVEVHPLYLTLPAALGCSLAFHLPVSTPANATIAGFANIRTKDMAIAGIGPSVICISILFLSSQTWGYLIFPTMSEFPEWAKHAKD